MDEASAVAPAPMRHASLFLSYARRDDEAFVARLHDDLAALGFDLWWDRRCMPNRGLAFLREIRDAVGEAERVLLVFGPVAAASDYITAEWQYACSIGTPVTTVLRLGEYEQLPDALGRFDVLDFRVDGDYTARLETLVRQLEQPVAPLGRLVGVPELPPQFRSRSAELESIRAALLRDSVKPVVLTSAGRRAGMQGMGGIGKSVLAAAVARDFDVRRAFPDGLVWVTLGAEPSLPVRLAGVCGAFGGARDGVFDAEHGRAELSELLADRAALLVLDDAWQLEHVRAFDAIGPRCALLVTTRDARLLDELGATTQQLEVLTPEESLRLMAAWLAAPEAVVAGGAAAADERAVEEIAAALSDEARHVARDCGYLPLALALSAAQVRDGGTWAALLEALQEADLEYLDHPNGSVFKSMKVGVDALEREDARFAARYVELSVFPDGAAVPEATVMTLWQRPGGLNRRSAEKLLATLARRALIRLVGEPPRRTIQLHALQHDYVQGVAAGMPGLHATLLNAYSGAIGGAWPEAPDDGYIFQHLAHHLAGAGRDAELCALLTSSPAWLEAQFEAGAGDAQFAADLELALTTAAGRQPLEEVRLTAARHVVSHRVESYSDVALEALVYLERSREAISHARLRRQPPDRIRALVRVARALGPTAQPHDDLLDEAFALAPVLDVPAYIARPALYELARVLFDVGRTPEALETARRANELPNWLAPGDHDELVVYLAERQRFSDAAATARTIGEEKARTDHLLYVARLARDAGAASLGRSLTLEAVSEALEAGTSEDEESAYDRVSTWRCEALQSAAELLGDRDPGSPGVWREAVGVAAHAGGYRDGLLTSLATKLARRGETALVLEAIAATEYGPRFNRSDTNEIVQAALEARRFDTALAVADLIETPVEHARHLATIASALHDAGDDRVGAVLSEAAVSADAIEADAAWDAESTYGSLRADSLWRIAELADRLGEPSARELADLARSASRPGAAPGGVDERRPDPAERALALAEQGEVEASLALALRVSRKERDDAFEKVALAFAEQGASRAARRAIESIDASYARSRTLAEAAASLAAADPATAGAFFEEAIADDDWPLGPNLLRLGGSPACWNDELIERALSLVPLVQEPSTFLSDTPLRLQVLQAFLPRLAAQGSISGCQRLVDAAAAADLLSRLEPELAEQARAAFAAGEADLSLLLADAIVDADVRSSLLSHLAAVLAEAGDGRAADVARSVEVGRSGALEAVALARARQGEPDAESLLEEAFAAAEVSGPRRHDAAARSVASALAGLGDSTAALTAIGQIANEPARVGALADVAPMLIEQGRLDDGVAVVRSIGAAAVRARGYLVLAAASGDRTLFAQALGESDAGTATDRSASDDLIAALCDSAATVTEDEPLVRSLFAAARAICDENADRRHASGQQVTIVRGLARVGSYAEALELARTVGPTRDLDFGGTRAEALGLVADALARARRADEARAAAAEADDVGWQAFMGAASLVPFMPAVGFDTAHRRRIEQLLAEAGEAPATEEPAARDDEYPSTWSGRPDAAPLEGFLVELANGASQREPREALLSLKEATRIAGWTSRTWRAVSEAIGTPSPLDGGGDQAL